MMEKFKNFWLTGWDGLGLYLLNTLLVVAMVFSMIIPTCVCGHSMDPTLNDGQRYLAVHDFQVRRGDIVVANSRQFGCIIVKRVIAIPGDTLEIRDNVVYVNGQAQEETYIQEPMDTQDIPSVTLGEDEYFLMGDNRNRSADSRRVGLFTRKEIRYVVPLQHQTLLFIGYLMAMFAAAALALGVSYAEEKLLNKYRKQARRSMPQLASEESV